MKPTRVTLQLADRSVRYPVGIIEDVLVRVGKFVIPADFLVLETGNEADSSLILGRPFLLTGGVLIDVPSGKLTFKIGDEREEGRCRVPQPLGSSNRPQHSRCEAYKLIPYPGKEAGQHSPKGLTYSFERIQQLETELTTDYTNGEILNCLYIGRCSGELKRVRHRGFCA